MKLFAPPTIHPGVSTHAPRSSTRAGVGEWLGPNPDKCEDWTDNDGTRWHMTLIPGMFTDDCVYGGCSNIVRIVNGDTRVVYQKGLVQTIGEDRTCTPMDGSPCEFQHPDGRTYRGTAKNGACDGATLVPGANPGSGQTNPTTQADCSYLGPNFYPFTQNGQWGCGECRSDETIDPSFAACVCRSGTQRQNPSDNASPCVKPKANTPPAQPPKQPPAQPPAPPSPPRLPAKKADSSSTGYIVGGVALFALAGGLIYWQSKQPS
jgi:hypothetical protein